MAALNGYRIGDAGTTYAVFHVTSPYLAPVFEPDFQDYGDLFIHGDDVFDLWASINAAAPLQLRKKNRSEVVVIKHALAGQSGGGPAGERVGRYSDDFYHRIHLTPSQLYLGNLISVQYRTVEVWNAFFVTVDLTDVQLLNGDGLTVTPPVATPYTMGALQPLTYNVSISTEGPPSISATMRWTIDGIDYDVPVTGNRVIAWALPIDWANPPEETLEWKTAIVKSYNAEEQRAKLRSKARRIIRYYHTLQREDAQRLENLLWGWQSRLYAVPIWTDVILSQTSLYLGQTVVVVDTDNYGFGENGLLFITDGINYEMQEISAVGSGDITLSKGLDSAWQAPVLIGPAYLARIDGDMNVSTKWEHSQLMTATIPFAFDPITTDPHLPVAAAPTTYQSKEIFYTQPNWRGGLDTEFNASGVVLDFGLGAFAVNGKSNIPEIVRQHQWLLKNRAEITSFRKFLSRRSGRFDGFWMPTWRYDFTLSKAVSSGDFGFQIKDNSYSIMVNGSAGRNHVAILLKNGTWVVNEISSAGPDDLDPTLTNVVTTAGMGFDFLPSDVRIACVLEWYRLFSDSVTLKYHDRNVVEINTSVANVLP